MMFVKIKFRCKRIEEIRVQNMGVMQSTLAKSDLKKMLTLGRGGGCRMDTVSLKRIIENTK